MKIFNDLLGMISNKDSRGNLQKTNKNTPASVEEVTENKIKKISKQYIDEIDYALDPVEYSQKKDVKKNTEIEIKKRYLKKISTELESIKLSSDIYTKEGKSIDVITLIKFCLYHVSINPHLHPYLHSTLGYLYTVLSLETVAIKNYSKAIDLYDTKDTDNVELYEMEIRKCIKSILAIDKNNLTALKKKIELDIIKGVSVIAFLAGLIIEDFRTVYNDFQLIILKKGEKLSEHWQEENIFFLVFEGEIAIYIDNNETPVIKGKNEYWGAEVMLLISKQKEKVIAINDTTLFVLTKFDFWALVEKSPAFKDLIEKVLINKEKVIPNQKIERRNNVRLEMTGEISLDDKIGEEDLLRTIDISRSGISCVSDRPLPNDKTVTINLRLWELPEKIRQSMIAKLSLPERKIVTEKEKSKIKIMSKVARVMKRPKVELFIIGFHFISDPWIEE